MAVASLAVPVAAYYAGRVVALSRVHGAAVANAAPVPAAVPPAVLPAPPPEIRPTPFPEAAPSDLPPVVAPPPRVRRPLEVPTTTIDRPLPPTPTLPDPPPLVLKPSIASPPRLVAAAPAAPAFHNEGVTAYIKPAPHSTIAKAIRKIPLLRGIARPRKEEGFVPASPVAHPLPALPDEEVPAGEPSVELLAHIDRSGSVDHVRFADGNSHLRDASASALSQWRFEPARQNGEPVESELLVRFEFRKEP
jgi:protein TonB